MEIGFCFIGTLARQRKQELEKLNTQLRKINDYLKSKAMIETYAPGLVYAPVGRPLDDKELTSEKEMLRNLLKSGKKYLREKRPDFAYEEFKKAFPIAQRIGDENEEKKAARGLGKKAMVFIHPHCGNFVVFYKFCIHMVLCV